MIDSETKVSISSLNKEEDELTKRLSEIEHKKNTLMLSKVKTLYEGKNVFIKTNSDIIRIKNVIKIQKWGDSFIRLHVTGEVLRRKTNHGFDFETVPKYYMRFMNKRDTYGITINADLSLYSDMCFITDDEWRQEVKRAKELEKWMCDKTGIIIEKYNNVAYIKDGEIVKHKVYGFDEKTGLFAILCKSRNYIAGDKEDHHDYRPGSELICVSSRR